MYKIIITVLSIIMMQHPSLSAQASNPLEVTEYTLGNGLTVWINIDHSQPKVFGAVVVKAGSKDSPNTGIAHYFEHIMFKGTDKLGTIDYQAEKVLLDSIAHQYDTLATTSNEAARKQVQQEINQLSIRAAEYCIPNEFSTLTSRYGGSKLNAGTGYDHTVYHNEFSPQYLEQWAMLNSERLINPVFRMFQSELETVYEEKNMYNDMMGYQAFEHAAERFFAPHPYAYPIIGSAHHLKNPSLSAMRHFFDTYYTAGNMGLVLVGDIDTTHILPLLERTFARIAAGEAPQQTWPEPTAFHGKETYKVKIPIPLVKAQVRVWRGVPANHPDEVALRIATGILSNKNGTGYLDQLTTEGRLMMSSALSYSLNEAGAVGILAVPKLMLQTQSGASKLAMQQVQRVQQGDFSDELFMSLKLAERYQYYSALENIDSRAQTMIEVMARGTRWSQRMQDLQAIDQLSRGDIIRVAQQYMGNDCLEVTKKYGHYESNKMPKPGFAPITPQNTQAQSEFAKLLQQVPVKPLAPRLVHFDTDVSMLPLSSMASLYTTPNPINDIFSLRIEYEVGTLQSTQVEPMSLYLQLLGTDSASANVFKSQLQQLGSTLRFSAQPECFAIEVSGFDRHFAETIVLLGSFMQNAKAEQAKIKQIISDTKVARKAETKDLHTVASATYQQVRYGNMSTYLNRLSISDTKKIKGTTLVEAFQQITLHVPCTLHYCGQLSTEQVSALITKHLVLPHAPTLPTPPAPLPYRIPNTYTEPTVYVVDMPKSSQTVVMAHMTTLPMDTQAQRNAATVFNRYFGQGMSSVVFQEIREFRSLAYHAHAYFGLPPYLYKDKPGYFEATLTTQSDKTLEALTVLDSIIQHVPWAQERLWQAQQAVVNEVYGSFPSMRNLSPRISRWKREGYQADPGGVLLDSVSVIDLATLQQLYQTQLASTPMVYIVVGNTKQIDLKKLASFGKIKTLKFSQIFY